MAGTCRNWIVIGVGNPDRGDDAAGRAASRILRDTLPKSIEVAEHEGEAAALLARLQDVDAAFLIDALSSGAPPGTISRFDVVAAPLPQEMFALSTHGFGVGEAIELARALNHLPPRCIIYGIEGASFAPGAALSRPVEIAVADVAERLRNEICEGHKERHRPCMKSR
jgi:hydrogenase maturation protease